eukprot:g14923.t1
MFTCTSANVVYCIRCCQRGLLYHGETKWRLGDRFVEHLHSVRDKRQHLLVTNHFDTCPSWVSSGITTMPPGNWRSSSSYSTLGASSPMVSMWTLLA